MTIQTENKLQALLTKDFTSILLSILNEEVMDSAFEFNNKEELIEFAMNTLRENLGFDSENSEDTVVFEEVLQSIKTKLSSSILEVGQGNVDSMEFYNAVELKDTNEVFRHNAYIPKGKLIDLGELSTKDGFFLNLGFTTEALILPYLENAVTKDFVKAPFLFEENMASKYLLGATGEVVIFGTNLGMNIFELLKNKDVTKITAFDSDDLVVEYLDDVILPQLNAEIPVEVFSYSKGVSEFLKDSFIKNLTDSADTLIADIGVVNEETLSDQTAFKLDSNFKLVNEKHLDSFIRLTLFNAISKAVESKVAGNEDLEMMYLEEALLGSLIRFSQLEKNDDLFGLFEKINDSDEYLVKFMTN